MKDAARPSAIIADDEPRLAEFLAGRLDVLWPELLIVGVAANGPQAQAMLASDAPDIAFLDIRMPGLTGLEVARTVAAHVHVVFVTAYDQYAVDAFNRAAVDYLLKPVVDERLAETVARLKAKLRAPDPVPALQAALEVFAKFAPLPRNATGAPERLAWIRASAGAQVRLIAVEDV